MRETRHMKQEHGITLVVMKFEWTGDASTEEVRFRIQKSLYASVSRAESVAYEHFASEKVR
jgi:cobalamin-dependent methionine synthase I